MRKLTENHKSVTFFEVIGFITIISIESVSIAFGLTLNGWRFGLAFFFLLVNIAFANAFLFYTKSDKDDEIYP